MKPLTQSPSQVPLVYGGIVGLLLLLFGIIENLSPKSIQLVFFLVTVAIWVYGQAEAVKAKRQLGNEQISFGAAFSTAYVSNLLMGLVNKPLVTLYMHTLGNNPNQQIREAIPQMKESVSGTEAAEVMETVIQWMLSPWVQMSWAFLFNYVFMGALCAIIIGLVLKKEDPYTA